MKLHRHSSVYKTTIHSGERETFISKFQSNCNHQNFLLKINMELIESKLNDKPGGGSDKFELFNWTSWKFDHFSSLYFDEALSRVYNSREERGVLYDCGAWLVSVMNGIHINITFFIRFPPESLRRLYFQCYLKVCFVGSGPNVGDSIMLVMSLYMNHWTSDATTPWTWDQMGFLMFCIS